MPVTRHILPRRSRTTLLSYRTHHLQSEPLEIPFLILPLRVARTTPLFRKNISDLRHFIPHLQRVLQDRCLYHFPLSLPWHLRLSPMTPELFCRGCEQVMVAMRPTPSLHQENRSGTSGARLYHQMLSKLATQGFNCHH
jgi:hypothetical protein